MAKDYYEIGQKELHEPIFYKEYVPGRLRFECSCGYKLSNNLQVARKRFDEHEDEVWNFE